MENILGVHPLLSIALVAWILPWKGFALWKASQKKHMWWFLIILVVNTMALLDILYIFYLSDRLPIRQKTKTKNDA